MRFYQITHLQHIQSLTDYLIILHLKKSNLVSNPPSSLNVSVILLHLFFCKMYENTVTFLLYPDYVILLHVFSYSTPCWGHDCIVYTEIHLHPLTALINTFSYTQIHKSTWSSRDRETSHNILWSYLAAHWRLKRFFSLNPDYM